MMKRFKLLFIVFLIAITTLVSFGFADAAQQKIAFKNLLVDGNMEKSGVTDWTTGGSPTVTKSTSNPFSGTQVLRVAIGGTANPYVYQSVLTNGQTYRIQGRTRGDATAYPEFRSATDSMVWTGTTSTTWQPFNFTHTATGTYIRMNTRGNAGGGNYVEWEDVTITLEAPPQKVAFKNLWADGNCEASGVTAWYAYRDNASKSKQTANPFKGTQSFRSTIQAGWVDEGVSSGPVLTVGKIYQIKYRGHGDGTIGTTLYQGTGQSLLGAAFSSSTSWQVGTTYTFTAAYTSVMFYISGSPGNYIELDDITLTEYTPPQKVAFKNLLVDGNMEASGTTAWTSSSGAVITKQTTNPYSGTQCIRIATSGYAYNSFAITVGQTYRLQGRARSDGTSTPVIGQGGNTLWTGTTSTAWQPINVSFTASGLTSFRLYANPGGGTYSEYDDLTLTLE
ncbi:MAG: hypothetical protein ACOZBH_04540 [Patescibacteria group bacterium]